MDKLVHLLELCDAVFSQAALREWSLPTCSGCSGQVGTRCSPTPPALDGLESRTTCSTRSMWCSGLRVMFHVVFWAPCGVPCGVLRVAEAFGGMAGELLKHASGHG